MTLAFSSFVAVISTTAAVAAATTAVVATRHVLIVCGNTAVAADMIGNVVRPKEQQQRRRLALTACDCALPRFALIDCAACNKHSRLSVRPRSSVCACV